MEFSDLQKFVLIIFFTGMILGVGVLTLDSYSRAVRTTTSTIDKSVNVSSGSATLSQTYCVGISSIINTTGGAYSSTTYNVSFTDTDSCIITSDLPVDMRYNITYTYGASSASQTTADGAVNAISPIASTWLPLIVTVAVLAIIMSLVIGSFMKRR